MANPTIIVAASATLTNTDIATSTILLNRLLPAVAFKSVDVQYRGYLNLLAGGTVAGFFPNPTSLSFGVVFVRNLGGQGSGNFTLSLNPTGGGNLVVVNVDVGAMFLYISPLLASLAIGGITPGFSSATITSGTTTAASVEIFLAA